MSFHKKETEKNVLVTRPRVPDVEHDVPDDVVVEDEGCLLGQLGDELDEGTDDLEDLDRVLTRQLLHEKLEKQGRVVHQARPDDLKQNRNTLILTFKGQQL